MSSQPKQTTTTQVRELPSEFKPLLGQYVDSTQSLFQNGMSTAPLTGLQQNALNMASGFDTSGLSSAQDMNNRTINGEFLNSNKYLEPVLQKSLDKIKENYQSSIAPSIDSMSARQGIFGGSAWQQQQDKANQQLASQLSDTTNQALLGNYNTERANQMNAINNAPSLFSGNIGAAQGLFGLGANEQAYNQSVTDEERRRQQLLAEAIGLGYSGASTSSTGANPNYVSPLQQALGYGLAGAKLFTGGV